jgi:hypothetical protein
VPVWPIELTRREFDLLLAFLESPERVLSRTQLLSMVWGFEDYDANVVEVYVSTLRRKLEQHGPRSSRPSGASATSCAPDADPVAPAPGDACGARRVPRRHRRGRSFVFLNMRAQLEDDLDELLLARRTVAEQVLVELAATCRRPRGASLSSGSRRGSSPDGLDVSVAPPSSLATSTRSRCCVTRTHLQRHPHGGRWNASRCSRAETGSTAS